MVAFNCRCPAPIYGLDSSLESESARNGTRIVICTGAYANVVDGVSRTLNRLVKDLNDRSDGDNYKILILAPVRDPPAMEHFGAQLPLPSMKLPFRGEYSFSYTLSDCVIQRLTEFRPDIMHIATPDLVASQVRARHWPVLCSRPSLFGCTAGVRPLFWGGRLCGSPCGPRHNPLAVGSAVGDRQKCAGRVLVPHAVHIVPSVLLQGCYPRCDR
jgi:hypothetical protein